MPYMPKNKARADVAVALRERHLERAKDAGLTDKDLEILVTHGRNAQAADIDQKKQLAEGSTGITLTAEQIEAVFAGEAKVRVRVPGVIADLREADAERPALFLERLSVERFALREIKIAPDAAPATPTEATALKKVQRVAREDNAARLEGVANYLDIILAPDYEPIVAAFSARRLPREWLAKLAADARSTFDLGKNVRRALEATAREDEAVAAQNQRWAAVRRLVKDAVVGVPELEALYAAC